RGVPEVDGAIATAAGQVAPCWVEGDARNLAALPFELAAPPLEGAEQCPLDGIPKRYRAVEAAAGELLKCRIKSDAFDRAMVPFQRASQPHSGRHVRRRARPPATSRHRLSVCVTSRASPRQKVDVLTLVYPHSRHQRRPPIAEVGSIAVAGVELVGEP